MIRKIKSFLKSAKLGDGFEVTFLAKGSNNISYLLDNGDKKLVFRICVNEKHSGSHGLRNEHIIQKLFEGGIAPKPFIWDGSKKKFPYKFRIETFVEGMKPKRLTEKTMLKLARILAELHSKKFAKCGKYPGKDRVFLFGEIVKPYFKKARHYNELLDHFIDLGECHIEYYKNKLKEFKDFTLIHLDLHIDNLVLENSELKLLDWEYAEIGDPAMDIAILFWYSDMFGYAEIPERIKQKFMNEYVRLTGNQKIRKRVRIYEALVVLYQLTWYVVQIRNAEKIGLHAKDDPMLEKFKYGIKRGIEILQTRLFC